MILPAVAMLAGAWGVAIALITQASFWWMLPGGLMSLHGLHPAGAPGPLPGRELARLRRVRALLDQWLASHALEDDVANALAQLPLIVRDALRLADQHCCLERPRPLPERQGVVAQQLIPTPDGKSRRVAMEIMLGTPLVQDYIRDGEIHKLKEVMKESTNLGMKTFDQALFELYQAGEISYEDALRYADSANEVRLRIKLAQGGDAKSLAQGLDGVEIAETEDKHTMMRR